MADITITVAEAPQQKQGKAKATFKDTGGQTWYIWPDKMWAFIPGTSYLLTDIETSQFQGRPYKTIKAFQQLSHGSNGTNGTTAATVPMNWTQIPTQGPVSDNVRRMDIFICGAFNNLMANQNVNPTEMTMMDMVDALHKFKGAWMGVFGPSPLPQRTAQTAAGGPPQHQHNDMNDDIPF